MKIKTRSNAGVAQWIVLGGLIIGAHLVFFGFVYLLRWLGRPADLGAVTLPAVLTGPPPPVPEMLADPVRPDPDVPRGTLAQPRVMLGIHPVSAGIIAVEIPAFCEVDWSLDGSDWFYWNFYAEPTNELFDTTLAPTLFFRARPARP